MYSSVILSIIIPVYNVEKYLDHCLENIVEYDGEDDIELILVNDGSTDNSLEICRRYSKSKGNVKIVSQQNQGLSEARNTGIKNAIGKYLLFLDSDDFLYDNILHRIVHDIRDKNNDMFLGRAYKFYGDYDTMELSQVDYKYKTNISPDDAFDILNSIDNFWFAAWLVIIKRDFLLQNNLFFKKGILHEDELWVPTVFIKASSIGFLNYGFYCYRLNREGSIVTELNIKREFDKLIVADELGTLYGKNSVSDKILNDRRGAIEYGLIKALHKHKDNEQYKTLHNQVRKHIGMLNYGKYRPVYLLCRILGVSITSLVLSKL